MKAKEKACEIIAASRILNMMEMDCDLVSNFPFVQV